MPHNKFPNLWIHQGDWESPGNLTLKFSRIWIRNFHRTGGTETLGGHKQKLACTRSQEKGAVIPEENEPDFHVSVWESVVEAWVNSGLQRGQGYWQQQSWEVQHAGISPFGGGRHYLYCSLPSEPTTGGNTAPVMNRKLDLRFTEHGLTHQSKTQFSPEPIPPIRNLAQASYTHPSEGIQNENHNNTKLTKMITWITALCNLIKLWTMLCRAT